MVNVNKKYLGRSLNEESWQKFESELKRGGNVKKLLTKYLSPDEFAVFEKRLAIISLLEKGKTYLEIRRELDASPSTVSFVRQGFKINKKPKKIIKPSEIKLKPDHKRKFPRYKGVRGFGFSEW
ncbi:MAG: helix-turn-helix domain-containing protein [Candidatus Wolfebacteria bacterium]|nr:helix-turn-helix domain-containing protein [Candidatus Wolfebacteria bacterium]